MTELFRGFRASIAAVALLAAFALMATSCEELDDDKLAVSVAKSSVSADAGSHLVYVECYLNWTLSLYASNGDTDWARLSVTSGSGDNSSVVLSYDANTSTTARTLSIILACNGKEASCTFTQAGATVSSGSDGNEDGDQTGGEGGDGEGTGSGTTAEFVAPAWLELPALDNEDLDFYTHSMTISSTATRNYSFYWDKENLVSHWVAYPLCAWNISSGSRTNEWGYDPSVPTSEQPLLASGYKGNYDRGHQIPSADRLAYNANVQTFYYTNMTPQRGTNFNQTIWADFESTVRSWANKSDTLYVVTGCVVDGSTSYAYDNNGTAVTVPVAYYKVLLRYLKSSTVGYNGYLSAAFYLEHKDYSSSDTVNSSMFMTVDQLEEQLGIDFFVNLPDVLGEDGAAQVESMSLHSWWGIN